MTYRAPDPQRTAEATEKARRREEEERAEIAAMKDPFARLGGRSPRAARIVAAAALLLPTATLVMAVSFHDTHFAQKLPGVVLAEGLLAGFGAIVLGTATLRVERGPAVVAIVCGVVALPWTLVCAFFALLVGGGMMLR
jgi:hypothetical protein